MDANEPKESKAERLRRKRREEMRARLEKREAARKEALAKRRLQGRLEKEINQFFLM